MIQDEHDYSREQRAWLCRPVAWGPDPWMNEAAPRLQRGCNVDFPTLSKSVIGDAHPTASLAIMLLLRPDHGLFLFSHNRGSVDHPALLHLKTRMSPWLSLGIS